MDVRRAVTTSAHPPWRAMLVGMAMGALIAGPLAWRMARVDAEAPHRNHAFVWLSPRFGLERSRPPKETVRLRADDALMVILAIPDPFASEPYDVVAYRRGTDVAQWRLDGLVPVELAELAFIVPSAWLAPGEFIIDLHGDGIGDAVIASYAVAIQRR